MPKIAALEANNAPNLSKIPTGSSVACNASSPKDNAKKQKKTKHEKPITFCNTSIFE